MKKKLFTLVILLVSAVGCFAQDSLSNSWGDIRLSAGLAMGRDFAEQGFTQTMCLLIIPRDSIQKPI